MIHRKVHRMFVSSIRSQHHDRAMSGSFFEELGDPDLDVNLEVGSGLQTGQTTNDTSTELSTPG
jgi:hypothetical protein